MMMRWSGTEGKILGFDTGVGGGYDQAFRTLHTVYLSIACTGSPIRFH
jgi:hypothetical protein